MARMTARVPAMHRLLPCVLALLGVLTLTACATGAGGGASATYVLLRHAEKADDGTRDPPLSTQGAARARRLAERMHFAPVVAVYASAYRRTQQTATPIARDHRLTLTTYDAAQPAAEFAERLRAAHHRGTVVVVGHANTVPALAQALCRCTIDPIAEGEYGRRISITVYPDGRATVDDRGEP